MTTERGGSPRQEHVPTKQIVCPVHGAVEARVHKIGVRPETGQQRYRVRCPQCHADRETARKRRAGWYATRAAQRVPKAQPVAHLVRRATVGKSLSGQLTHAIDARHPTNSVCGRVQGTLRAEPDSQRVGCTLCRRIKREQHA